MQSRRRSRTSNGSCASPPNDSVARSTTATTTTTTTRTTTSTTTRTTTTKSKAKSQLWWLVTMLVSCWTIQSTTAASSLLNGRYETATDVTNYLNLAQDVAKMNEAERFSTKLDIYKNGIARDEPNSVTLQSLSFTAGDQMNDNPLYHMFRYAFWDLGYNREGEEDGFFDGAVVEKYADTVVQDLFELDIPEIEADAALVLNVWMAAVNGVFQSLASCKAHKADAGIAALDKAVALWIGAGQEDGSNEKGHLLYNLAENAGERFDQDYGETSVNTYVIDGFLEMQRALASGACEESASEDRYAALRATVQWITGMMTVPLVQNLIHHTMNIENEGGSDMVELYALGILPGVATCDPHGYDTLLSLTVINDLSISDADKAVKALQHVYSCLGVSCVEVGSYMGGAVPACRDFGETSYSRGGYKATSKEAQNKARIDRDVLQIDVFLKYNAKELALDWYTHGWNADFSLQNLAENQFVPSLSDSEAPYFPLYSQYYGGDDSFHDRITNLLTGGSDSFPEGRGSTEQIRRAVTGLFEFVVLFVNTADALKYASVQCSSGSPELARKYADAAAMLYVGSMEGPDMNSNRFHYGKSLFSFAHDLCTSFDTCDTDGSALINKVVVPSLQSVADNIDSANCQQVKTLIDETILPALSVPLIQGVLKYASANQNLRIGTKHGDLASGDAVARGILPLVNKSAPKNAEIIKDQMQYQQVSQPVAGGFKTVADALRGETLSLLGVDCSEVGTLASETVAGVMCGDGTSKLRDTPHSITSPLGFGRYNFSDPVAAARDAAFAMDVRSMFHAKSPEDAALLYQEGLNALESRVFGSAAGLTPSLGSLSTMAHIPMKDDPTYNIYKFALYQDKDFETGSDEEFAYGNDIALEALSNGGDSKLAAESTVILHVFMVIAHKLSNAVRICEQSESPESEIDSAVALWLGENQGEGKFEDGWMMYSIAQSVQKFFGLPEEEASVNTQMMALFLQAQTAARGCSKMPGVTDLKFQSHFVSKLRFVSQEIVRLMTEPLIKSLLFHMVKDSKNMVELYTVAVVPQCAACDLKAFKALQDALFSGYHRETSLNDDVLDHLGTFLRCQEISCYDIRTGPGADESLTDLTNRLCKRLGEDPDAYLPLAGYTPQRFVKEEARLDLDGFEMYVMMRTQAYGAAKNVYQYGHNSMSHEGSTLASFANLKVDEVDYSIDEIISNTIAKRNEHATATREESAEMVRRVLQSMVSHNAVLQKLKSSVSECDQYAVDKARDEWDKAVAYFVGSMQGSLAGGKKDKHGVWMYTLGNEFCNDFGNCETSGEAKINQELMFNFASGRDSMVDGECSHMKTLVSDVIRPKLLVPLIQGVISASVKIADDPTDATLVATLHILTRALIPHIEKVNPPSAAVLKNAFGTFSSLSTVPQVSSIFEAFRNALDGLNIPCNSIGNPRGYNFCGGGGGVVEVEDEDADEDEDEIKVEIEDTPTNLADNLYVTTTYVQDRANIALDIQDMAEALEEGNTELAQLLYRKGKNSEKFDANGKLIGTRSIKEFSTKSTNDMLDEPEFNLFLYTLENQLYADTLVEDALKNSKIGNSEVATEAAVVLNIWMEIVHLMHEALKACKEKELKGDNGVFLMDAAVAYWIGDGQVAGDGDNGHLLYALSEKYGEAFKLDNAGQSRTNTNILRLFNEAKNEFSLPNACSESQTTYKRLRGIVNRLISQMAIPLIQGLITNLRANDRERVKIYAHAFVPLVAGCRKSLYESLKQLLLSKKDYNVVDVEPIIGMIRQAYGCLGLQCDDIGVLASETTDGAPECKDPKFDSELAGYRPSSDVRGYSRLDLDIREMDVLLQMKAYSAVDELYTHGKHATGVGGVVTSIGQLATTKHRSIVPEFESFVQYYGSDTYADDIIRGAFDPLQLNWTDEQRRTVVVKGSQVLVMYFAALQNAYEAVSECNTQRTDASGASDVWDQAAALLTGSLQGINRVTDEGYMFYDLAQEYCVEFGTCLEQTSSSGVNDEVVTLLYTGRGAALSNSCRALEKAADELSGLLLVPIIQGALSTSTALTNGENSQQRALAYVYSRALVPLVRRRNAASDLDLYLGNPAPSDKKHTASKVYAALATAYPKMYVDCEDIGNANGIDTCTGVVYVSDYLWIIALAVILVPCLCFCCCVCFYFRLRAEEVDHAHDNYPKFVRSNGETNHSMDLLEKAFSKSSPKSTGDNDEDGEIEALNRRYINDRAKSMDSMVDEFADEYNTDQFNEVAALTSNLSGDII